MGANDLPINNQIFAVRIVRDGFEYGRDQPGIEQLQASADGRRRWFSGSRTVGVFGISSVQQVRSPLCAWRSRRPSIISFKQLVLFALNRW